MQFWKFPLLTIALLVSFGDDVLTSVQFAEIFVSKHGQVGEDGKWMRMEEFFGATDIANDLDKV